MSVPSAAHRPILQAELPISAATAASELLIPFVVSIAWRAAAETFDQSLRMHGVQPSAVTDVEVAWHGFADFVQTEIAGVAPADEDGDGFVVQWGRRSWGDNRLLLTMTRQHAVRDADAADWQLWQVELRIAFDDEPKLIVLERGLDASDTCAESPSSVAAQNLG